MSRRTLRLVALAYIIPFLLVAIGFWEIDQQRKERRALAAHVFAETRAVVLSNCRGIEKVKAAIRATLERSIVQSRARMFTDPEIQRAVNESIIETQRTLATFKPLDCRRLPLIRRGENPYPT